MKYLMILFVGVAVGYFAHSKIVYSANNAIFDGYIVLDGNENQMESFDDELNPYYWFFNRPLILHNENDEIQLAIDNNII